MPTLLKLKSDFLIAITDCRALYRHCLSPKGQHSEAGVEAAFLQMFKTWENLLEDCTIAYMCQRLRCDGKSVPAYSASSNEQLARRVLLQDRAFLEWTDIDRNIARWQSLFQSPSLLEVALRPAKADLNQMKTTRNAIAHSSSQAEEKFRDLIQNQFGGKRRVSRPAEFLTTPWPKDTSLTYFDRYANVLETTTPLLTG